MVLRVTDKDKGDDILRVMMNRRAQNVQTETLKEQQLEGRGSVRVRVFLVQQYLIGVGSV